MREDILKHMSNLSNSIEELLATYDRLSDTKKQEMDIRLVRAIQNLRNIVQWSKNE